MSIRSWVRHLIFALVPLAVLHCGEPAAVPALTKVRLQTDWFPQAEHGGFYQALACGYYKAAGLDVELLPGGPGAHVKPKVVGGDAEFGMNPATDILIAASRGLSLVMVAPFLQHDHEALLLHEADPARGFADLEGRTLTASPGLAWIAYLKSKYGVRFSVQPVPYGMAPFFADARAIRQCVVTHEPYVALRHGVRVRVLRLAEAGYDPYHVLFCSRSYAKANPEVVRAFVAASLRGWSDYVDGDPAPAHRLILERNRQMTRDLLEYSRGEMILRQLVTGDPASNERVGAFSMARLGALSDLLVALKVIEGTVAVKTVATTEYLPAGLR
jgi:NitT/TauT family transport system substrate-binding protein